MAFASANIPPGLTDSGTRLKDQGWALGPLTLPFQLPFQPGGASGSGGPAKALLDVWGATQQLKQLVRGELPASTGRGGVASTSNPGRVWATGRSPAADMRLEYTDDTPRLVGKRSIAFRPRHTLPLSGSEPIYDDRDPRWWDIKETALHGSYSWAMQDYQSDREEPPVPGDAWRAEMPSEEEMPPVLTCKDLVKQVLVDQHGRGDAVQCAFADQRCPAGSYKVMAFYRPIPPDDDAANFVDYHFYVQHRDVNVTLHPGDRLRGVARFLKLPVEDLYDANPSLAGLPEDQPTDRERTLFVPNANVWSHKPSEWLPPRLHDGAGRVIHNPMRAVAAYSDDEGDMVELPATYCCSFCVRLGEAKTGRRPPGASVVQE